MYLLIENAVSLELLLALIVATLKFLGFLLHNLAGSQVVLTPQDIPREPISKHIYLNNLLDLAYS